MLGGVLELIGLIALLAAGCELWARAFPERLIDEMQTIAGDVPSPIAEPEVRGHRNRGAL